MTASTLNNGFNDLLLAYGLNIGAYIAALTMAVAALLVAPAATLKSSTSLAQACASPQLRTLVVFALLSLSGVPPFFGFFAKFFLITLLAAKGSWVILLSFGAFNLFALYFYFQQIRYLSMGPSRKEFGSSLGVARTEPAALSLQVSALLLLMLGGALIEGLVLVLSTIVA
jgi:NADH:ubiquinone oxidoreductase subunit 2 (subunit N)